MMNLSNVSSYGIILSTDANPIDSILTTNEKSNIVTPDPLSGFDTVRIGVQRSSQPGAGLSFPDKVDAKMTDKELSRILDEIRYYEQLYRDGLIALKKLRQQLESQIPGPYDDLLNELFGGDNEPPDN